MDATWPVGLPTRLRPIELVGEGTSALVWRARDRHDGRDVAVKVMAARDPRRAALLRDRLEREGRALARLRDLDGVVRVHALGLTPDGVGWLVTEFADEGSLADRGAASTRVDELTPVAGALFDTLAGVHERDVVHGDLSPANLLLDRHGAPRIADFGLAALQPSEPIAGGLTPAFAAPERLDGAPPSAAGDVHALAASLRWALATGPGLTPAAERLIDALDDAQQRDPGGRPAAHELARRIDSDRPLADQ